MAAVATMNGHAEPKIMLYTSHECPFAHRAHITLAELGLPFEETLIDLKQPRPQWYLDDINPRGLVPSMIYEVPGTLPKTTITESAIVSQFLMDTHTSHLAPVTGSGPAAALQRARMNFFVDAWTSKIAPFAFAILKIPDLPGKQAKCAEWLAALKKEIEPLLADAAPFFGGSKELTYAEVMVAPFVVRQYALAREPTLCPPEFVEQMDALPNFSRWSRAVAEKETVMKIFDSEKFIDGFKLKYGPK